MEVEPAISTLVCFVSSTFARSFSSGSMKAPIGIIPKSTIPDDVTGTFAILARTACAPSWTSMITTRASIPSTKGRLTPGSRNVPPGFMLAKASVPYRNVPTMLFNITRAYVIMPTRRTPKNPAKRSITSSSSPPNPIPLPSEAESISSSVVRTFERKYIALGATKRLMDKSRRSPGIIVFTELFFLRMTALIRPYEIVLPTSERYVQIFGLPAKLSIISRPFLLFSSMSPSSLSSLYFLISTWPAIIISAKTRKNLNAPDIGSCSTR